MRRILIILGILLVIVGVLWPWISRLPWGHLPGDIIIKRLDIRIFIPITTMIIVSMLLSLLLWLFRK